jgi:uncharacterized membrane protein
MRTGQTGWKLYPGAAEKRIDTVPRGDDTKWKVGVLFVDTKYSSFIVPKRFGYGYTLNFRYFLTWVLLALPVVVLTIVILFRFHII